MPPRCGISDVERTAPLQHLAEERPVEGVAADVAAPGHVPAADQLEHAAHHLRQHLLQRAGAVDAGHRGDPQRVVAAGELVASARRQVRRSPVKPAVGEALRRLLGGHHRAWPSAATASAIRSQWSPCMCDSRIASSAGSWVGCSAGSVSRFARSP